MSEFRHIPVLLHETLDCLQVEPNRRYIDATLGGGGHTEAIVARGGKVLGVDQDAAAIEASLARLGTNNVIIVQGNFREIGKIAKENGFEQVNGILFDLGMSSFHLDQSERGFSFSKDEPLDMRMNVESELTAEKIVNTLSADALAEIFMRYGEEEKADLIAAAIVKARKKERITSSRELAAVVESVKRRVGKMHPATLVFQAIRIAVNEEMEVLKSGLAQAVELLIPTGRLAVISFHSLEDRIVKSAFRELEQSGIVSLVTKKPIIAGEDEIKENPRSRSAKLRVVEKI
jgi:16S rRNA (cytosine1402-N4)-methyltransferase